MPGRHYPSILSGNKEVNSLAKLLHIVSTFSGLPSITQVEVDELLHTRGSDFTVFRNKYDVEGADVLGEQDRPLLRMINDHLMADEHCGVEYVEVKKYELRIHHSTAVSPDYVLEVVREACRDGGYQLIEEPRQPGPVSRGLRVSELDSPLLVLMVLWRSITTRLRALPRKAAESLKNATANLWSRLRKIQFRASS